MTEDSTVNLETGEEIDWLRHGRQQPATAEARHEFTVQATKELLQTPARPWTDVDATEVDEAYQRFTDVVNMSPSEIRDWGEHECSDRASVKPEEVRQRVIKLLETPEDDWGQQEVEQANRVSSFVSRMRGVEQDDPAVEGCPSDRDISLMNWGYRPDSVDL